MVSAYLATLLPQNIHCKLGKIVACALPLLYFALTPVAAKNLSKNEIPTWSKAGVLAGYDAKPEECTHVGQIWIADGTKGFCIRYFENFDRAAPANRNVVVLFSGDFIGFDFRDGKKGAFYSAEIDGQKVYDDTMRMLAEGGKTPLVIIGRPGTMGSSGDHTQKYWRTEARIMDATVDALEAKYGFSRVVLAGHSGGALLVANMLAKRQDVACAVMASGAIALTHYAVDINMHADIAGLWEDPLDSVGAIKDTRQPLIVFTGENDLRRPEKYQAEYAAGLKAHSLNVYYWVLVKKGDPHDTRMQALQIAKDCAAGKSPDVIAKRFKIKKN